MQKPVHSYNGLRHERVNDLFDFSAQFISLMCKATFYLSNFTYSPTPALKL